MRTSSLLGVATVLFANLAPVSFGQDSAVVTVQDIQAILLEYPATPERSEEQVLKQLVALGEGSAPILFQFFAGGPAFDELFEVEGVDPQEQHWWGSPDQYGKLSVRVLCENFPRATLDNLTASVARGASLDDRLGALHLTADLANEEAFALWLAIAMDLSEDEIVAHITRVTLRNSLVRHLQSDPQAHLVLVNALSDSLHPILRDEISRASERCADPRSLLLLEALLDAADKEIPGPSVKELIPRIDPLARRYPWVLGDAWGRRLIRYTEDEREPVRLLALGALAGDAEALDLLVEILEQAKNPREAWAARKALASTFDLRADLPENSYLDRAHTSLEWWNSKGELSVQLVAETSISELGTLYRSLVNQPAYARSIASIVASELEHLPIASARGTLAFLAQLGEPAAAPALVDALQTCDPALITEISLTLEILTGIEHRRDYQAWKDALAL